MTGEPPQRTGAARDVPPPRPVRSPGSPGSGPDHSDGPAGGIGGAARALADAVSRLLDQRADRPAPSPGTGGRSGRSLQAVGTGLRDVVAAVSGALGEAWAESAAAQGAGTGRPGDGPAGGTGPRLRPGALLGDLLAAAAPRLPVRDREQLRSAHPGATDAEIADALVSRAARLSAAVGAATGGLAGLHWFAPPSLIAVPLELGAETALVAAVELVLVGELHELHGRRPPGDARERALAHLASWSSRRAAGSAGSPGAGSVVGAVGTAAVRRALTRRLARTVPSAAPFMIGAALGGRSNRRGTEDLARRLLDDLRGPRPEGRVD